MNKVVKLVDPSCIDGVEGSDPTLVFTTSSAKERNAAVIQSSPLSSVNTSNAKVLEFCLIRHLHMK